MAAPTPEEIAAGVPASTNIVQRVQVPGGGTVAVDAQGGVYSTGGAGFYGSNMGLAANQRAGAPIIGIAPTPDGKGYYLVDSSGAVQAYGDAKYQGGFNTLQGVQGQHQISGIQANPQGGYTLTEANNPTGYNFGAQPNPLYQDPAFLAFQRSSGLGVDQAVSDYENSVGLAQRARAAALAELNDPFGQRALDRQSLAQGYINRGFSGSGQQAQAVTGYDTETANQKAKADTDYTDTVNTAGQTEANTIGGIATKGIEQGLNTGNGQGWDQFWQGEAQKYPDQSDTILKNIGSSSNPSANGS